MNKEQLEKEAEDSWRSKGLWYAVNANENSYKTGFHDGYKKANEWTNVKDKLPTNDRYKTYIVIDKHDCSTIARFDDGKWLSNLTIENVVLWKEITFPSYREFVQAIKEE